LPHYLVTTATIAIIYYSTRKLILRLLLSSSLCSVLISRMATEWRRHWTYSSWSRHGWVCIGSMPGTVSESVRRRWWCVGVIGRRTVGVTARQCPSKLGLTTPTHEATHTRARYILVLCIFRGRC